MSKNTNTVGQNALKPKNIKYEPHPDQSGHHYHGENCQNFQ